MLIAFAMLLGSAASRPVVAQSAAPTARPDSVLAVPDSQATRGRALAEGRAAAATQGGWTGRGFAAGATLSLIGTGIVYAIASGSTVTLPSEHRTSMARESALYREHFARGYAEQVRRKRKSTALKGSLIGAAVITALVIGTGLGEM